MKNVEQFDNILKTGPFYGSRLQVFENAGYSISTSIYLWSLMVNLQYRESCRFQITKCPPQFILGMLTFAFKLFCC